MTAPLPLKRRHAINETGQAHFLSFSCWQRQPLLSKDRSRLWLIDSLDDARQSHNFAIWAYVIMPEHVHLLILPRQADYKMRQILAAIKAPVSREAKQHLQENQQTRWLAKLSSTHGESKVFRFWQPGGGYDSNLFQSKTIQQTIDYIHANPVRRGLVKRPTDWKWSSATAHENLSPIPLDIDQIDLGKLARLTEPWHPVHLLKTLFFSPRLKPKVFFEELTNFHWIHI